MNAEQLITLISELVDEVRKDRSGPIHVCLWEKKLCVLGCFHTHIRHPIFLVIKDPAHWEGLTGPQWTALKYKIIDYQKGCPECLKRSKSSTQPKLGSF